MDDPCLSWLDAQRDAMTRLLLTWAEINSGSRNIPGLQKMAAAVQTEFRTLGGEMREVELEPERLIDARGQTVQQPLGKAIVIRKRPEAPNRVLLNIHYDTVFGHDHPFQRTRLIDPDTLNGPGVVDAKGGLVVMLFALRALEQSAVAANLGWEVIVNPDEEIGSPGSAPLLREAAARNHVGLLFEPAMPDGSLVGERKGSGNFVVIVKGRAAHAGRDFHAGRSAILALAELILRIDQSHEALPNVTMNCGRIEGGTATNIVPDLAIARFNARVTNADELQAVEQAIENAVRQVSQRDGISIELHGGFHAPPKGLDEKSTRLMQQVLECARDMGLSITHKPSGGASDGNKLAAAGLPVVDTLGPVGSNLHSDQEFVKLPSLVERAKLTTLVLMRLAEGGFAVE